MLQYLSRAYKRQQMGITDFWLAFFPTSPFLIMSSGRSHEQTVHLPYKFHHLLFILWTNFSFLGTLTVEYNHFQWVLPISLRHELLLVDAIALSVHHHVCWVHICCFVVTPRPLYIVALSTTFYHVPTILTDCDVHQIPQFPLGFIANIINYY